jgi:hypothetical protein
MPASWEALLLGPQKDQASLTHSMPFTLPLKPSFCQVSAKVVCGTWQYILLILSMDPLPLSFICSS